MFDIGGGGGLNFLDDIMHVYIHVHVQMLLLLLFTCVNHNIG